MRRDSNICKELLKDGQKVEPHCSATVYWFGTHSDLDCIQLPSSGPFLPPPRPPPPALFVFIFACSSGFGIDAQLNAALWQRRLHVQHKAILTRPLLYKPVLLDFCSATETAAERTADFLRLSAAYGVFNRSRIS